MTMPVKVASYFAKYMRMGVVFDVYRPFSPSRPNLNVKFVTTPYISENVYLSFYVMFMVCCFFFESISIN